MFTNYKQVVPWDSSLIDVGFLGSEQSVPSALRGLAICGSKITAGTPSAVANQWAPGAFVLNLVTAIMYTNVGTTAVPVWAEVSTDSPQENVITGNAAGLQIHGGSASPKAQSSVGFGVVVGNTVGVPVGANTDMAALAGGNLAFDNGLVPHDNCCRMYTFLADVNPTTGAVTLSTINGADFPKTRPVNVLTDINYGDGTKAIIGFLYVKNESSAVFVPGTTNLDAAGITASFSTNTL